MKTTKELVRILLNGVEFTPDPWDESNKILLGDEEMEKIGENGSEVYFELYDEMVHLCETRHPKAALNEIIEKGRSIARRAYYSIGCDVINEDLFIGNYAIIDLMDEEDKANYIARLQEIAGDKYDDIDFAIRSHKRFKQIQGQLHYQVEQHNRQQEAAKNLRPYAVTPFEELIGASSSKLRMEFINITAAVGNYFSAGLPEKCFRPLTERGLFLRLVTEKIGTLTQELVDEFEADHMACIQRLNRMEYCNE